MSERALREYHDRTKHSYESIRRHGAGLDWSNEPSPFKEYVDLEPLALPPPETTGVPAIDAIARPQAGDGRLTAETLSHLLFHAAGVTRVFRGSFGEIHFRAYASAGALYPNEVYLVCGEIDGLRAGVYHYDPRGHALRLLRGGDLRGSLGLGGAPPGAASVVLTGIPWRTAWKYESRGFRHLYWDAGMIVANLLAAASADRVDASVLIGFVDDAVERVIGVDGETEFPLCVVTLAEGDAPAIPRLDDVAHRVGPISKRPRRDPEIDDAHAASRLGNETQVKALRTARREPLSEDERPVRRVEPLSAARLSRDVFETVVRRRGSSRRLAPEAFPADELAALLDRALSELPADWDSGAVRAFVVASALEGIPAGAYRYERGGAFHEVREGDLRRKAGFVCLEQRLAADAAAVVFLMADLDAEFSTFGARGYAVAQLEAAIVAGRLLKR